MPWQDLGVLRQGEDDVLQRLDDHIEVGVLAAGGARAAVEERIARQQRLAHVQHHAARRVARGVVDRDLLAANIELTAIRQWRVRSIAIGLLPQHVIVRVQVDLGIEALGGLGGELAVIIVRVGEQDALHAAVTNELCYRIQIVGGVHHVHAGVIAHDVDVIVHVPLAAIEAELARSNRAIDTH